MPNPPILFQSESIANAQIAGLPCAVRAAIAVRDAGLLARDEPLVLALGQDMQAMPLVKRELDRIDPTLSLRVCRLAQIDDAGAIDGLATLAAPSDLAALPVSQAKAQVKQRGEAANRALIKRAGAHVIASTGKSTDGIVSRIINRPISQFLSKQLLKLRGIRPIHGTIACALIGLVMALCLFFGGEAGLLAGAVLFQLASIVDGVDGEIARATFRSSQSGATLDTATDAVTNLAFIAGVSANLLQSGEIFAGAAGIGGLALLVMGLGLIGMVSLRAGGPLSFDALKHEARSSGSRVMTALSRIASRDVYAFVLAIMILMGLAAPAMVIFAGAVGIWFGVAMVMLARRTRAH